MKNSLKFLTATGLLLLGSLTAYNAALRADYRRGTFKDPLRNYTALPLRGFSTLAVPAAGAMRVRVEAGPYGVYVGKKAAQYVRVSQRGGRLTVALSYPEKEDFLGWGAAVVIHCPRLDALTAGTAYTLAGRPETQRQGESPNPNELLVQGFVQDSLRLTQDHTAHVVLAGNRLGQLRAVVGGTPGSTAQLTINADNQLAATDLRLEAHATLVANNLALPRLRWHLGDSARVELSGAALGPVR